MAMELRVPALGESIREATLGAWKHAEGDEVSVDEPLVEVESEKATVEVPSPGAGVLRKILRKAGDTVAVGEVIAEIEALGAEAGAGRQGQPGKANGRGDGGGNGRPGGRGARCGRAPSARRALAESGLAAEEVKGSGRGGRISKQDVTRALEEQAEAPRRRLPSPTPAPARRIAAPLGAAAGRRSSTARASGWCRCRRCARRSRAGWSRRSTPRPS